MGGGARSERGRLSSACMAAPLEFSCQVDGPGRRRHLLEFAVPAGRITGAVTSDPDLGMLGLRLCLGLLRPASGEVRIEGADLAALDLAGLQAARRRVAVVAAEDGMVGGPTVQAVLARVARDHGCPNSQVPVHVDHVLELTGLSASGGEEPRRLTPRLRWRAGFAQALVTRAPVIVIDDPRIEGWRKGPWDLTRAAHVALGTTFLVFTRSRSEAQRVANQVVEVPTLHPAPRARAA